MKVATVVGARPQFIKASMVSPVLRKKHKEILIHTGQHYDYNMSEQFFEELKIPHPDYNLEISGGTHAEMTGKMMIGIEKLLWDEKPDCLLVYGDTNSTLAAALAAAKLHIPVCHVEAGARTYQLTNPEEINRVCTDHISSLLLASTEYAMDLMRKEGIDDRAVFVGNTMYDAYKKYSGYLEADHVKLKLLDGGEIGLPEKYYYMTCHREENTGGNENLNGIFDAMEQLDAVTIYPVHPRNRERALRLRDKYGYHNIILAQPVGYLESICLLNHSEAVVTDSGGVQTEAFFAGKKCVTILDFVAWPETMVGNRNELARPAAPDILKRLATPQFIDESYQPFGDGDAGSKVVVEMEKQFA